MNLSNLYFKQCKADQDFSRLWHLQFQPLVNYAHRILKSDVYADDIVTEALIKYWENRQHFDSVPCIKSFLYKTVKNACIDVIRSNQIRFRVHQEIHYTTAIHQEIGPEERFEVMLARKRIAKAVEILPGKCKEVFILYFFHQESVGVIAEQLGINVQTVRNQVTKAKNRLAEAVAIEKY